MGSKGVEEGIVALALDGALIDHHLAAPGELQGHPEGRSEDARLALPAGEADGDAGATPHQQDPVVLLDPSADFRNAITVGNDHWFLLQIKLINKNLLFGHG
jgi:hypothetical protein